MNVRNFSYVLAAALVALSALTAQAQSASRIQTANIPFDFNVGDKSFAAGEYTVTRLNPHSDLVALAIRGAGGKTGVTVLTNGVEAGQAAEGARLVFNRYGDRYFLAQVWGAADSHGLKLRTSGVERSVRRELRTLGAPTRTEVALGGHPGR